MPKNPSDLLNDLDVKESAAAVAIMLPIGEDEAAGFQREQIAEGKLSLDHPGIHFDAHVGPRGAAAFVRVRNGLRAAGAKFTNGRPVFSNADVLRFICDAMAYEIESQNNKSEPSDES
jgi:hypothetical protein